MHLHDILKKLSAKTYLTVYVVVERKFVAYCLLTVLLSFDCFTHF